ncbi:hypothetical protein C5167_007046 [Papaver somniferum]|uniref:Serine protease n=1 Tax=Papaver somniferum TaxID=3469 RepID=A0A4Y7JIG3_PAPSO|nr:uncharacterized protein LOC113271629 [Papaver somniferum]RZC59731.1 hypothetical protein C5167_007046 [Papaver somniferum]
MIRVKSLEAVSFKEEFNRKYIPEDKIPLFYDSIKHTVVCLMAIKPNKEVKDVENDESPYFGDPAEEVESSPVKMDFKEKQAEEIPSEKMIFGTGVVLDSGFILTANHVVKGAKYISFRHLEDTNFYTCEVINHDTINDLAMLVRYSGEFTKCVEFGESKDIKHGRNVYCISNPGVNSHFAVFRDTFSIGQIGCPDRLVENKKLIQINNTDGSYTGSMGAPVFSSSGTLIGIITKIEKPYDFAVRVDVVMEFFKATLQQVLDQKRSLGNSQATKEEQ